MGDIYKAYLASKNKALKNTHTATVSFAYGGTDYVVVMTKRRACRLSVIRCQNSTVVWEQIPLFYLFRNERGGGEVIDSIPVVVDKKRVNLFVIRGKPGRIEGLDEGIFRSAKNLAPSHINLMSEKKFKEL